MEDGILEDKVEMAVQLVKKWHCEEALERLNELLVELKQRGLERSHLAFKVHFALAILHNQLQNTQLIEPHALQALKLLPTVPENERDAATVQVYMTVGGSFLYKHQFFEALSYFQEALHISRKLDASIFISLALYNIGFSQFNLGNIEQAEACFNDACRLEDLPKDRPEYFWSRAFLHLIHALRGQEGQAKTLRNALLEDIQQLPKERKHAVITLSTLEMLLDALSFQELHDETVKQVASTIEKLLSEFPALKDVLGFSIVFYHAKQGEFEKAWFLFEEISRRKTISRPIELKTEGTFVKAFLTSQDWLKEPNRFTRLKKARYFYLQALKNART